MGRKKQYKLIDKNERDYKSTNKPSIQGHRKLRIYCKMTCKSANNYWANFGKSSAKKERVFFENSNIAIEAEYSPCKICNPK